MNVNLVEREGRRFLVVGDGDACLGTTQDALDLIGEAFGQEIDVMVVPVGRFVPEFFQLRSRLAGEFIQKFVTYGIKFAIIGDIAPQTAQSDALRDFVRESNRGTSVFFLPDFDALVTKLAALPSR